MMENNYFFIKKYLSKQSKRRIFFMLLHNIIERKTNSNLFDKNCSQEKPQENVKCQFSMKKIDVDESRLNR